MSAAISKLTPGSRSRFGHSFKPSAASIVLGLTGGSDDEWFRLQRGWRLIGLVALVVLFAARLALPIVIQGFLRRWAEGVISADRLTRR
ncbi:MAG TPA: hypothetical protein VFG86_04505 [Chloroflexota bacterium]|jgi:hypothetical protein|nr:hypothetical protein [Chloroflexota bacterium]